ncbi:Uronyl 2-sulfotransferase [Nymphon striatum]|nr:Uronyl 2-sulfotransferase [Nymphon striatum]
MEELRSQCFVEQKKKNPKSLDRLEKIGINIFLDLKNTPPGPNTLLVYNRVPKAGSGTMLALLLELQKKNNFKLQVGRLSHRFMTRGQEVSNSSHFCSKATPLYMNVIRDPVERVISSFFYKHIKEDAGPLQYDDDAINDITNKLQHISIYSPSNIKPVNNVSNPNRSIKVQYYLFGTYFVDFIGPLLCGNISNNKQAPAKINAAR